MYLLFLCNRLKKGVNGLLPFLCNKPEGLNGFLLFLYKQA